MAREGNNGCGAVAGFLVGTVFGACLCCAGILSMGVHSFDKHQINKLQQKEPAAPPVEVEPPDDEPPASNNANNKGKTEKVSGYTNKKGTAVAPYSRGGRR